MNKFFRKNANSDVFAIVAQWRNFYMQYLSFQMELRDFQRHLPMFWNVLFSILLIKMSVIKFLIKNKLVKNTKDIKTPLILDLSKFVEDNKKNENKYSLCSAVYHIGNIRGGHYYNIRKAGDKWIKCDDSDIREVPTFEIKNIYYLVYKRI